MLVAGAAWADHDLDIYSFDNLFIFDTFASGNTYKRIFNIVVMDDTTNLKIAGQVKTTADYNVDGYAHYKNFLIVLLMNQVEIYDLNDPKNPVSVKTFKLQKRKSRHTGWGGIAQDNNKYILLSLLCAAELTMDDDVSKWNIEYHAKIPALHREDFTSSKFPPFIYSSTRNTPKDPWPFIVEETSRFRYEVDWEMEKHGKHSWMHKKYLRKVDRKDGIIKSSLLLGEQLETGGE